MLRPLLAVKWLESEKSPAPIEFERLLAFVDDKRVLDAINDLLERKKIAKEKAVAPAIPVLNEFIESELNRLGSLRLEKTQPTGSFDHLNEVFHAVLAE